MADRGSAAALDSSLGLTSEGDFAHPANFMGEALPSDGTWQAHTESAPRSDGFANGPPTGYLAITEPVTAIFYGPWGPPKGV